MYQALVLIHLLGVVVMAVAHGVSIFAAFRVRRETDPHIVAAILGMSKTAVILLYIGFLSMSIGGLGAAWSAGTLLAPWAIASYVVLVVVVGVMYAVATGYYVGLRDLASGKDGQPVDPGALQAALVSRRPEVLAIVGTSGLVILLWLMVVRPA
jgi:uncharacterized membrane protein